MVNGLDPLLDDSAAKTVDRLHRYAAAAERAYYRALRELRLLQTNRADAISLLNDDHAQPDPILADIAHGVRVLKDQHRCTALWIANSINAPIPGANTPAPRSVQNEPTAQPGPARKEAA
jgi:hypothetical protein